MNYDEQIAELEDKISALKQAALDQKSATSATSATVERANISNIRDIKEASALREHRNEVTQVLQAKTVLVKAKLRGSLVSMVMCMNVLSGFAVPALDWAQVNFPYMREFLPKNLYASAFILIILMNLGLRFFRTNGPLEDKI